jgi:DNA (cytosine-5)-methyltransferase 1
MSKAKKSGLAPGASEKPAYRVASLYCGAGGLDYGFQATPGFAHAFANDFEKSACATYAKNFRGAAEYLKCGPIEDSLPDLMRMKFDLLIAGFPCPSWSMAGKRQGFVDKRGQEFFTCLSVLHACKPRMFIFENVKGLLSHEGGKSFEFMLTALKNLGYSVEYKLVRMRDHGVPTERARVIIVGSLMGPDGLASVFPEAIEPKNLTLKDVLGVVGPVGEGGKGYPNHNLHAPKKKMHWIRVLKEGEELPNLSEEEVRRREAELGLEPLPIPTSIMDYRRLSGGKVAPTMMFGNTSLPIHPYEDRNLSVREAATVQGFPLDFVFEGGVSAQYKQVGNAVPPLFSKQLASRVRDYLDGLAAQVEEKIVT